MSANYNHHFSVLDHFYKATLLIVERIENMPHQQVQTTLKTVNNTACRLESCIRTLEDYNYHGEGFYSQSEIDDILKDAFKHKKTIIDCLTTLKESIEANSETEKDFDTAKFLHQLKALTTDAPRQIRTLGA